MNLQKARIFLSSKGLLDTEAGKTLLKAEGMRQRYSRAMWRELRGNKKSRRMAHIRAVVFLPLIYQELMNQLETYGYKTRY